jgi:hypothetical protein
VLRTLAHGSSSGESVSRSTSTNRPRCRGWVNEIAAIIDSFDALEATHGLTLDERVLRDDLVEWIGGEDATQDP